MYGYVVANKPELRIREYDEYRAYYCGLCHQLGKQHGLVSKLTLSYDMTFLVMLLTGLYEPEARKWKGRCIVHPVAAHDFIVNSMTQYVADMNVLLAYYKCIDDWMDDRNFLARGEAAVLGKRIKLIEKLYPKKADYIREQLKLLRSYETEEETDIDKVSACFGNIIGTITAKEDDAFYDTMYELGFFLGKYIYILDAYDDLPEDIRKKRFNVLKSYKDREDYHDMCLGILNGVMSRCAAKLKFLPIVEGGEILENIIYSGVWTRYEVARRRYSDRSI